MTRNSSLVVEAIEGLRVRLPFRLKSIDTHNGSEFINDVLLSYTTSRGLELTRSRPYRKNDQAWVEQKNGAVVRPRHQASPKPARHWRTRADPFVLAWPAVVLWLEAEPGSTAKELLGRLQAEHPGQYADRLLRALQQRVKEWRAAAARRLVLGSGNAMSTGAIPGEGAGNIVH